MEILNDYGFVIVTGILQEEEQTQAERLIYQDLLNAIDTEQLTPEMKKLVRNIKMGKKPWPKSSIPGLVSKGFLSRKGLPQGQFAWTLRTNPKCKEIYAHLHNTTPDDLVVGMDLPFFNPDPAHIKKADQWPHADQNTNLDDGCPNSYQGILHVWSSESEDKHGVSNTVVWPRSWDNQYHHLLATKPKHLNCNCDHGLYLDKIEDPDLKQQMFDEWEANARRVPVPAGALFIFNSRTIHQGYPGGLRLAQTLSWEPREYRSEKALKRKLQAIHLGIGTTHWASLGIHHGASYARWPTVPGMSQKYHFCKLPLKPIQSVALKTQLDRPKQKTMAELMEQVEEEYLQVI